MHGATVSTPCRFYRIAVKWNLQRMYTTTPSLFGFIGLSLVRLVHLIGIEHTVLVREIFRMTKIKGEYIRLCVIKIATDISSLFWTNSEVPENAWLWREYAIRWAVAAFDFVVPRDQDGTVLGSARVCNADHVGLNEQRRFLIFEQPLLTVFDGSAGKFILKVLVVGKLPFPA
jgi:hypothetical protein